MSRGWFATKRARVAAVVLFLLALIFFFVAAPLLDDIANRRTSVPAAVVSDAARELHARLWVADLHADSLMWNRDPLTHHGRGLVDIPRLIEGGVALQAFTIVSKAPWGMNISSNSDKSDMLTLLVVAQHWPVRTWFSLLERALYQSDRLAEAAEHSGGQFTLLRSRSDLARYSERRAHDREISAGFLGVEGAQVLEGQLANVQRLFDAGVRMMAPSHFFDTDVGGSAHGEKKIGLTPFGRKVLAEMERLGMLVDLSHASAKTIDDVLEVATKPIVFSHTGVTGTCNNQRNVSDARIARTAAQGGLVGIGFFESATCGTDLKSIVEAIRYTVERIGAEHVALGSDFDGFVHTPIDASQMPALTAALLEAGFGKRQIELIMGENVRRVLMRVLPE
jgi:membrane dipeptidase